nr:hypothetical protein [Tanacetum cinerariifolium]
HSSGSENTLHWQWELILPVGTLSWQWECLVYFIPNNLHDLEGDENHIRTLGYYSKASHEGYRNTIELSSWNNMYCMEDLEHSFVDYTSSRTNEAGDPELFTLPCRLRDSKPFDTLADLESCINIIPLYLFKNVNIKLLEETDHIFGLADGTESYPVGIVKDIEFHIGKLKLLNDFYVIDIKKDLETPLLVGRGFLATANAVIDCRMAKIVVGEGITRSVFAVKGVDLDILRQILHPNTLETIIQSSSNIIERSIAEFVQFINPHQPVLFVFILIDESSLIGVSGVSFLVLEIGTPATAAAAVGKAIAVAVAPAVVAGVSGGCGGIAVEVVARGVGSGGGCSWRELSRWGQKKKGWCGDDGEVAVVVTWEVAEVG